MKGTCNRQIFPSICRTHVFLLKHSEKFSSFAPWKCLNSRTSSFSLSSTGAKRREIAGGVENPPPNLTTKTTSFKPYLQTMKTSHRTLGVINHLRNANFQDSQTLPSSVAHRNTIFDPLLPLRSKITLPPLLTVFFLLSII